MKPTKKDYYQKEILRLAAQVMEIPKDQTQAANRILKKIKKYGEILKNRFPTVEEN